MKTFNVGSIKWQTKQMSEIKHAIWLGQSRSVQEIFAFKQTAAFLLGHSLNVSPPPAPINLQLVLTTNNVFYSGKHYAIQQRQPKHPLVM